MAMTNGKDKYDYGTYAYDWESITESSRNYECPRGHKFKTTNPIIIAVDDDPNYNSGPICSYCYVDWFKLNLAAKEEI